MSIKMLTRVTSRGVCLLAACSILIFGSICLASNATEPLFAQRTTLKLPEIWKVQPAVSPDKLPVPGLWNQSVASISSADSVWFELAEPFACPVAWQQDGRRVFLDFERIEGDAIIFINGRRVAELLAPGGEVEITQALTYDDKAVNLLTVYNTRSYTGISRPFEKDYLRHAARMGGRDELPMNLWPRRISAPVSLITRPDNSITDVFVIPSWRNKEISLEVEVDVTHPVSDVALAVSIIDANGQQALSWQTASMALPLGRKTHRLSQPWPNPTPWELEDPYLYRVDLALAKVEQSGAQVKTYDRFPSVNFGFREVWTEGRELLINGHPSRWRLTDLYGAGANALSFYRLMGYNVGQIQPHPKLWWRDWNDTPLLDESLLEEADRLGFGITAPAPSIAYIGPRLLTDDALRDAYEKELCRFVRKYRNHPSILAWAVGMNTYNPQVAIQPEGMGRRETDPRERGRVADLASHLTREVDPTRLAYSHADGGLGDICSANVYLNFAPLQEREEWPMAWAKDGDMPYSAVEFGQPYTANFWKGKQFLLTEYLAMYLGDLAYAEETDNGLSATLGLGLANKNGHGAWDHNAAGDPVDSLFPLYWKFQDLFVNQTNRAWRTWGVNAGWLHWLLGIGYGTPPGVSNESKSYLRRYKNLPESLTAKPSWANPNFDIHARSNQPFLAWIAGGGVHTDKTHAYQAGEKFEKQIAIVWDGSLPKTVDLAWSMQADGRVLTRGSVAKTISPGEISFVPLSLQAPETNARQEASLVLSVSEQGREIASDTFSFQVFPVLDAPAPLAARIALHDPSGKSGSWLRHLGVSLLGWKKGDSLDAVDVLLIGREAIKPGDALPYTPADIARGLRVIILAQQPSVWEMLGFETVESLPRYTFAADQGSPILDGLKAADLINWRGSPDLLPEGRQVRTYENMRAPRWTNRHAVASVALKIPEVVGFTPILKTEFDLAWSPLIEWRHGRGIVYFSTLDFNDRIGVDPVATRMARNLLQTAASPLAESTRRVWYRGGEAGAALLQSLQLAVEPGSPVVGAGAEGLLVVAEDAPVSAEQEREIARFVSEGGKVFYLPRSAAQLKTDGFAVESRRVYRAQSGEMPVSSLWRCVGPELLRWRDALEVQAFASHDKQPSTALLHSGGLALERRAPTGKGREIFFQLAPSLLADRYANDAERREAVQLSVSRLHRLVAQVLTNLGASSSSALATRVCHVGSLSAWQPIASWHVFGPWPAGSDGPQQQLTTVWPGEKDAMAGDDNPNNEYRRPDGVSLDWRRIVQADESGFVDLAREVEAGEDTVVYAQRKIVSDRNRIVRMRFGADYWLKLWVNGRVSLVVDEAHGPPKPATFQVDVPLRKGENVLAIKVIGGSKGVGFWADRADAGTTSSAMTASAHGAAVSVRYYQPLFKNFDPYQFHYW